MADRIESVDVIVASPGRNYVTVRITTADGVVGLGDATVNGRELAVASCLRDHIAPTLIGRDPGAIEDTWQYLYRGSYWRRGPLTMAAIGGVDTALWDILGRRTGQPVHQLLGGRVREHLTAYRHAFGWDLPSLLGQVDRRLAEGCTHVRVQSGVPGLDTVYGVSRETVYEPAGRAARPVEERWDAERYIATVPGVLGAVREHVGDGIGLLHDAHHRLTPNQAARLARAVEPVGLYWLEDVTPAEDQEALALVRSHTTTPLAIGEVFNTVWDCQRIIEERLTDYIRCAVVHAGGISHARKIFALAEIHGAGAAPHGPSDHLADRAGGVDPSRHGDPQRRHPGVHGPPRAGPRGVPPRMDLLRRAPRPRRRARSRGRAGREGPPGPPLRRRPPARRPCARRHAHRLVSAETPHGRTHR